jgi:hypothetical protein
LQARNFWHHTLRHVKDQDGNRMMKLYKSDPVSKKRTAAVTEAKQRHFFNVVETARKFCFDNSPPAADGTQLRDLEEHFVGNGDEEVALASMDGVKFVGSAGKKRHLRNSHSSRASISFHRCGELLFRFVALNVCITGTAAGEKLPTIYLLDAVYRPKGWGDEYLRRLGNAPGSTIICTKGGYMTHRTWMKVARILAKYIRRLPVVRDHPDWWFRLHLDGLTAHEAMAHANQIFFLFKILIVIENSHSSQVLHYIQIIKSSHIIMRIGQPSL